MKKKRVLVIDDSQPWRDFVLSKLGAAPGLEVIGEVSDGQEAVWKAKELHPDLILLDIGLPTLNGIEAARQISRCAPTSKILFVSGQQSPDLADAALATGALGYLTKLDAGRELLPAIDAVLHNQRYISSSLSQDLALGKALNELPAERTLNKRLVHRSEYQEIVEAAAAIMRSQFASMQMLYPERGICGELRLLAFLGFTAEAAVFWDWVSADSKCTCGIALRDGRRVVVADIASCEFMADSEHQQVYMHTGIRACQTTPLISRTGKVVGMLSTHWSNPHRPSEQNFLQFDILAKHAAELIEGNRSAAVSERLLHIHD